MVPILPFYLLFVTLGLAVACLLTLLCPLFSSRLYIPALVTYGKTALDIKDQVLLVRAISVPKRWFTHFYILASLCTGGWVLFCVAVSRGFFEPSDLLRNVMTLLTNAKPQIPWSTGLLVLLMIFFHVLRRCYESLLVSVYSDTTMNIGHYIMGVVHYIILPLTVCCEMQGVATKVASSHLHFDPSLNGYQFVGIAGFFYCNWQQHKVAQFLAGLRKGSQGLVNNYAHGICYGGWFDLVSCPHFLFEVGIYLSLFAVLQGGFAFKYMVIFVVVNQIFAALITHRWYRKTFKSYPIERKAIIPYLL